MTYPSQYVFADGTSDPANPPAAGQLSLYFKSGALYFEDSSAVVTPVGGGGGTPGGSNTQIQFNNSGAFGGSSSHRFDATGADSGGALVTVGNSSADAQVKFYGGDVVSVGSDTSGNAKIIAGTSRRVVLDGTGVLLTPVGSTLNLGDAILNSNPNAAVGTATLVGGTVTVAKTNTTSNTYVFVSIAALGTVTIPQAMLVTVNPGVDVTFTSADPTDTSSIAYFTVEGV